MRGREIYYMLRVANYASRPLRELSADFRNLGREGDVATKQLERLQIQQDRLRRSIGLRQATVGALRQSNALAIEQRQLALDRARNALATKRAALNQKLIDQEIRIDQAIETGNRLETQRAALSARNANAFRAGMAGIGMRQARLAGSFEQLGTQRALLPAQMEIAGIGATQARARLKAFVGSQKGPDALTAKQREAALAGSVSASPRVAKLQAQYLGYEKAVRAADLQQTRLKMSTISLDRQQEILAQTARAVSIAEDKVKISAQEAAISLDKADAAITDNAVSVDVLRRALGVLNTQVEALVLDERALTNQERALVAARIEGAAAIAKENEAIALEIAQLRRLLVVNDEVVAAQARMNTDRLKLFGRTLQDVGRTAQYAGGIIVGALGFAAHAAANFQTEATNAATQVGTSFKGMQVASRVIQEGILRQMRVFPASADDMAKSAYQIYSSITLVGNQAQKTAEGLQVLRVANKAAVAGNTDLADSTQTIIKLYNIFGRNSRNFAGNMKQLNNLLDETFSIVKTGAFTFQEFSQALVNSAPIAKNSNQSITELGGALAFLSRQLGARGASVSYARLLEFIQRAEPGLKKVGVAVRDTTGHIRPLSGIIQDIARHFKALSQGRESIVAWAKAITKGTGAGTIGTAQMRRALIPMITQFGLYNRVLQETAHRHGLFEQSFKALAQTSGVRFKVFMNNLKATALVIGAAVIPALMKLIKPIQDAIMWFNHLSRDTKNHIATWGAYLGAILLVSGTLSVLAGTVIRMIGPLKALYTALRDVFIITGLLEGEVALLNPWVLGAAAVLALVAAYIKWHKQIQNAHGALGHLRDAILNSGIVRFGVNVKNLVVNLRRFGSALINAGKHWRNIVTNLEQRWPVLKHIANVLKAIAGFAGRLAQLKPINIIVNFVGRFTGHGWGILGTLAKNVFGHSPLGPLAGIAGVVGSVASGGANAINYAARRPITRTFGRQALHDAADAHAARVAHNIADLPRRLANAEKATAIHHHRSALAQVKHNRSIQDYIKLQEKVDAYAKKHPLSYQAQLRAAKVNEMISKKFKGAELSAIEAVVAADEAAGKKITKNHEKEARKRIAAAKAAARAINTQANEAASNLRQIYDTFSQQNQQAFGDVTSGVRTQNQLQFGNMPTSSDLLKDMRNMLHKFRRWRNELGQLAGKVPYAMIQQLEQAGPDSELVVRGLLHLTPKQLTEYKGMFTQGQKNIEQATRQDFNMQLDDWRKRGKKAAIAFMRGVGDEKSYINKAMRNIFLNWLHGGNARLGAVASQANPRGHHRAAAHHTLGHEGPPRTHPTYPRLRGQSSRHLSSMHYHDNITIVQGKEDLSTTLRKARLSQKNRRVRFA